MSRAKTEQKDRLAQALRANLRRRKAQARDGAAEGLPAGEPGDPDADRLDSAD